MALVWQWIYSPNQGLLNELLGVVGVPPQRWLIDPTLAMPAIVAMSIWQGLGVNVIIFLAGLQAVPIELIEAEMRVAMALTGATTIHRLDKQILVPNPHIL